MCNVSLHLGDCLDVMATLEPESIDSIVTDPPYGLSFMGKHWDHGIPGEAFWREMLRVAKPGAHLLAFGGTRTHHRLMVAIEDAGWEIRDCLMWIYGSGFPKSMDVSKAIDKAAGAEREVVGTGNHGKGSYSQAMSKASGFRPYVAGLPSENNEGVHNITVPATEAARQWEGWGTALKPAFEPIIMARKPLSEKTVAQNVLAHGTGGINIDACRVASEDAPEGRLRHSGGSTYTPVPDSDPTCKTFGRLRPDVRPASPAGRWPANVIHDGSEEVVGLFPVTTQNGYRSNPSTNKTTWFGAKDGSHIEGERGFNDTGSASRFFKTCSMDETELFFCSAKAIMEAWNLNLANTAESSLYLSNELVVSVLSHAVTAASRGDKVLSDIQAHFTNVTQTELRKLCETLITAILCLEKRQSPAQWQGALIPNGCLVRIVETQKQTDTTTITISHWKSDGCADDATFSFTRRNTAHGEKDLASRFAYCAKASKRDQDEGLEGMKEHSMHLSGGRAINTSKGDGTGIRENRPRKNSHPTVKPTDLMRYLCRLVTPPDGVILDPFMGSGSTGKAAMLEGFRFVGIELEPEYLEIAKRRIDAARRQPRLLEVTA